MWKSLISIKEKEKNEVEGWFWVKLTLNHPSLMDEGKEPRVLVMAHKREREERINYFLIELYNEGTILKNS